MFKEPCRRFAYFFVLSTRIPRLDCHLRGLILHFFSYLSAISFLGVYNRVVSPCLQFRTFTTLKGSIEILIFTRERHSDFKKDINISPLLNLRMTLQYPHNADAIGFNGLCGRLEPDVFAHCKMKL